MSFTMYSTDEVFAALRGLCSNSYRMYDPSDYRYYYDHECDAYECVVDDAAKEYERLLKHCEKQREELAAIKNQLGNLKEAFGGDMDNIDGGTNIERIEGFSRFEQGSSITDELREWAVTHRAELDMGKLYPAMIEQIADRIDERYAEGVQLAWADGIARAEGDLKAFEATHVKLPVDAYGLPIEIGDYLHCDETGRDFPCRGYCCSVGNDGERRWTVECSYDTYSGTSEYVSARRCHHVQPDTWERIIEDAIAEGFERTDVSAPCEVGNAELVERCRRLAGC